MALNMCTDTDDGYKSADDTTMMTTNRQRMKPWLIERLHSKKIVGFQWVNEDKKTFRIPWRHGSRHGWNMRRDAGLFEQWAIHSGKYTVGQKPDPKKWKANFRCALNSLRDVEELKDEGEKRGSNAFKIYRFLEKRRPRFSGVLSKRHITKSETTDENKKRTLKKCGRRLEREPESNINYNIFKKEIEMDNEFSSQHETVQQYNSVISNDNANIHKGIKKSIKHHYSGYTLVKQTDDGMTVDESEEEDQIDENCVPSDDEIVDMILAQEGLMCYEERSKPICNIHMTIEDLKTICSRITGECASMFPFKLLQDIFIECQQKTSEHLAPGEC